MVAGLELCMGKGWANEPPAKTLDMDYPRRCAMPVICRHVGGGGRPVGVGQGKRSVEQ